MADLTPPANPGRPTHTQDGLQAGMGMAGGNLPTARQQLAAVAWMRWRMYLNGFRRINERAVIARIFGYLLAAWLIAVFTILPAVGAGFVAYAAVARHRPHYLFYLLWSIFFVWHFFALNSFVTVNTQQFDETALIRFPLTLPRYLVLKFVSSLLTIGFAVSCGLFLAMALGIGLADSSLFPAAACALLLFLVFNLLLSRALQTWINRWLSTRRAREIVTVVGGLFFVGIQLFRLRAVQQQMKHFGAHAGNTFAFLFTGRFHAFFAAMPPSLAAQAVFQPSRALQLACFAGLLLFLLLALAIYAWRVRKQFFGELLTDSPAAPKTKKSKPARSPAAVSPRASGTTSPLLACLQKEWTVQRRNTALLMQMLLPLVFVVIFSAEGQMLARHPAYALPGAIGYAMLNALGTGYNLFGSEGAGVQFYLIAPVRIRDAVAAKHILIFALALVEGALAIAIVLLMTHALPAHSVIAATALWTIFVILVNLTAGAFRSLTNPIKIDPNKVSLSRRNASGSRAGAFLTLGVLAGSLFLCYPVLIFTRHHGYPWAAAPVFALLVAAAIAVYVWMLNRIDTTFLNRRENLIEVLTKAGV